MPQAIRRRELLHVNLSPTIPSYLLLHLPLHLGLPLRPLPLPLCLLLLRLHPLLLSPRHRRELTLRTPQNEARVDHVQEYESEEHGKGVEAEDVDFVCEEGVLGVGTWDKFY